jgi:hypothetical protein
MTCRGHARLGARGCRARREPPKRRALVLAPAQAAMVSAVTFLTTVRDGAEPPPAIGNQKAP